MHLTLALVCSLYFARANDGLDLLASRVHNSWTADLAPDPAQVVRVGVCDELLGGRGLDGGGEG